MTMFLSVVGLLTVLTSVNCQFRFDYSFDAKVGGWLKLHRMPVNFIDAFRQCESEGAILASPLNDYLKKAMVALHKHQIGESSGLYTGIHSTIIKGTYASVEGRPLAKIPVEWAPNEPDNYDDSEDCIIMLHDGKMADVHCNQTFPYICYKKKTLNMATNECGTTDDEYQLDTRTDSCYKFHYIGRTWREAYRVCMGEGGYLGIVNSDTEAQVMTDLFDKNPVEKIFSDGGTKNGASVGFYDWGDRGVWRTIHGQNLQEAGYAKWAPGEPNGASWGEYCGSILRTAKDSANPGILNDVSCNVTLAFICEMSPNSLTEEIS